MMSPKRLVLLVEGQGDVEAALNTRSPPLSMSMPLMTPIFWIRALYASVIILKISNNDFN